MPLEKLLAFTQEVSDLADKPNATMTAAQVKAIFDAAPNEVRTSLNQLIDDLQSVVDGDSGADNIKATLISGLTGDTVQTLLEALKTLVDTKSNSADVYSKSDLLSETDGNSGADKIKATPIGTSPNTIQGILEWLKTQIDATALNQIPDGSVSPVKLSFDPATQQELDTHSNDTVKHITSAERTKWDNALPKTGGDLTGQINVPSISIGGNTLIKSADLNFGTASNAKADIEFGSTFVGSVLVTIVSTFADSNASGVIQKRVSGLATSGTIHSQNSVYLVASDETANHFAISDLVWDAAKQKFVVKIVHRTTATNPVHVKVEYQATEKNHLAIGFSSIYTTDTTVYGKPVDLKQSFSDGKINVRNAITGRGGTVADADGDGYPTFAELVTGVNGLDPKASGSIANQPTLRLSVRGLSFTPSLVVVNTANAVGMSVCGMGLNHKTSGSAMMSTANGSLISGGFDIDVVATGYTTWKAYGGS